MAKLLAIDPGSSESAFVLMDQVTCHASEFGKIPNEEMRSQLLRYRINTKQLAVEMIASYGMPVGKEVFETCVWIGRFLEIMNLRSAHKVELIYRREEKMHICESQKANDATIRHALIDRFAKHDFKFGRGTKKNPDWFYGFKQDMWAAYAVGLTYIETKLRKEQ